jgi:hypothetical protein
MTSVPSYQAVLFLCISSLFNGAVSKSDYMSEWWIKNGDEEIYRNLIKGIF